MNATHIALSYYLSLDRDVLLLVLCIVVGTLLLLELASNAFALIAVLRERRQRRAWAASVAEVTGDCKKER